MVTVVNNPAPSSDSGSGVIVGVIVLVALAAIVWFWGIPMMNRSTPTEINVPATQIVVPEKIDVNVNQTK